MACNTCFFDEKELEVVKILLQLPQLMAQERNHRDSHFQSSWSGKRRRCEIKWSPPTPSRHSPLLNTSATPSSSSTSKSDSMRKKMTKQELLQNTLHVTENIRRLKQDSGKMQDYEMLRLTSLILKQMEIEVSYCVKQKEIILNSSPETVTGPATELPSQAPVEEEEKGEDANGVLEQAEASGSGTGLPDLNSDDQSEEDIAAHQWTM